VGGQRYVVRRRKILEIRKQYAWAFSLADPLWVWRGVHDYKAYVFAWRVNPARIHAGWATSGTPLPKWKKNWFQRLWGRVWHA
jgi:hypothetical protein